MGGLIGSVFCIDLSVSIWYIGICEYCSFLAYLGPRVGTIGNTPNMSLLLSVFFKFKAGRILGKVQVRITNFSYFYND